MQQRLARKRSKTKRIFFRFTVTDISLPFSPSGSFTVLVTSETLLHVKLRKRKKEKRKENPWEYEKRKIERTSKLSEKMLEDSKLHSLKKNLVFVNFFIAYSKRI